MGNTLWDNVGNTTLQNSPDGSSEQDHNRPYSVPCRLRRILTGETKNASKAAWGISLQLIVTAGNTANKELALFRPMDDMSGSRDQDSLTFMRFKRTY